MKYIYQKDVAKQLLEIEIADRDFDCVDNRRYALATDDIDCDEYAKQRSDGCCGFFDAIVEIAGNEWKIGCNYGH